jgi:hypothetical protein
MKIRDSFNRFLFFAFVAALINLSCTVSKGDNQMEKTNDGGSQALEHLFDIELQYQQGMAAVTSSENKIGHYLGSGDGAVKGPKLQGAVRWDLSEEQGEPVCRSNLRGLIETNDGAQINFDTMGFFMRPNKSNPQKWNATAAVHFNTTDRRYEWLNTALAVWEGEFDMGSYRHHYKVYIRARN